MTVAFANHADLSTWIKNHAISKRFPFLCFGNRCYFYLIEDPDPDMEYWFGYNPHQDTFFISDNIARNIRESILCMEYKRLNKNGEDKSHLSAVRGFNNGPKTQKKYKPTIKILRQFYRQYAGHLEALPAQELTKEQRDVIITSKYLQTLPG
ncbi:MAG: hypothetical protein O3A36_02445 [bacterium]|nr:hypothetical protein [bacterium]